jgi:hypothetical protein
MSDADIGRLRFRRRIWTQRDGTTIDPGRASFSIGDDIGVTLLELSQGQVLVEVTAPRSVRIVRGDAKVTQ